MATTLIGWQPSALSAACPPVLPAHVSFSPAQARVLGSSAAPTVVRTKPAFAGYGRTAAVLSGAEIAGAVKINNYIGTPAARPAMGLAVLGATTSSLIAMASGDLRDQRGADKVKGADARGIPPRGKRAV